MALLDNPAPGIGGGRAVVTTATTAVVLTSTDTSVAWVIIQAETDNTGKVAVGDSGVVAAIGTQSNGVILTAGESVTLPVADLNALYIDSTVSGDGVTYFYGKTPR